MQTTPIRVALVDDNDMLRYGLHVGLETFADIELVGEGRNGLEAIDLCRTVRPDVMLIDLIMPDFDGFTAIRHIRQEMPDVRCIALTSYDEVKLIHEALQTGAISYLIKNMSLESLAGAIRDAYAGKSTFSQEVMQVLREGQMASTRRKITLTERECQILQAMLEGVNDSVIAARLSLEKPALEEEIQRILAKLNASNRTEALVIALRDQLISSASCTDC